jgi:hypothetical protein
MARGIAGRFKMKGGSLSGGGVGVGGSCPPGVLCMDVGTIFCVICIVIIVLGFLAFLWNQTIVEKPNPSPKPVYRAPPEEKVEVVATRETAPRLGGGIAAMLGPLGPLGPWAQPTRGTGDPRFSPLAPEQSYYTPPDPGFVSPPIRAGVGAIIPINVQTQGYPDTYQQIGVLTAPGGTDMSATPNRTVLPLFGRKLTTNRDRWNYYTRSDGMNPVQVPVQFKRRNCDDDTGCDEIITGDSVGVPILGQSYTANVFRYSTPRYLPV